METVIELKPFGEFWQVTHDGNVIVCAVTRQAAINATAGLFRRQLKVPAALAGLSFIGLEAAELLAVPPMDPNWKRKEPLIEVELFDQAEGYLQTELVPEDEVRLLGEYRSALAREDFGLALERLAQLGESQDCTNPFWRMLERLVEAVWPTKYMVDRRAKGQRETKITAIKARARGWAEPDARAAGGRDTGYSKFKGSRRGRR